MTPKIASESGRKLVWLASYPKSGNTWLRAMLTAALNPEDPLDLDALAGNTAHGLRQELDDLAGIETAMMSAGRLIPYQRMLYREIAQCTEETVFLKTHSAWLEDADGAALFPADACAGVIYCVRNPVDIVPSYADHENKGFDRIIGMMSDPGMTLNQWDDRSNPALPQLMQSWSDHVASWLEQSDVPLLLVRYEDMLTDPGGELARVLEFCANSRPPEIIARAVEVTKIDRLKQLETLAGFAEKPSSTRPFFVSGRSGRGAERLSPEQIACVLAKHGDTMKMWGYPSHLREYKKGKSSD